jgi:rhomboid protease GluP
VVDEISKPSLPQERAEERLFDGMDRPWLTAAMVSLLVAVHLAIGLRLYDQGRALLLGIWWARRPEKLLRRCGAMWAPAVDRGELWRLVSAQLLHGDGLHMLLNALSLAALGRYAEGVYGRPRTLGIFLLSGLGAEALSWVGGNPISVGASGGIFGLIGALVVFGWREVSLLPEDTRAFFRRNLLWLGLANLGVGLLIGLFGPWIDNLAHVGGLVGGALLGSMMGHRLGPRAEGHPLVGALLWALCALLLGAACLGVWRKW